MDCGLEIGMESPLLDMEEAIPCSWLYLRKLLAPPDPLDPRVTLRRALAAGGIADGLGALASLRAVDRELEELFGARALELWRDPLARFLREHCCEIALAARRVDRPDEARRVVEAARRALLRAGGCGAVAPLETICSQTARICVDVWCEGERRGRALERSEVDDIVRAWQARHAEAHLHFLDLQLHHLLGREAGRFVRCVLAPECAAG